MAGSSEIIPLTPDAVLPEQFFPASKADTPEIRLMMAILEDAVQIIRSNRTRQHRAVAEARRWVLSDDVSWPFSFVNVCEILGLPLGGTREMVLRREPARQRNRVASQDGKRAVARDRCFLSRPLRCQVA
jgi:hypothetical protein